MKITEETVDRISTLAKLSFDVKEKDELIIGLKGMMGFVTALENYDLISKTTTEPLSNFTCPLAEDKASPSLEREKVLSTAPMCDDTCFIVPKTVEEG